MRDSILLGTVNADGTITGATSGGSAPVDLRGVTAAAIIFTSVGTTSGGTLLIEEASSLTGQPYSGTWSVLATVLASAFTGGAQQVYHLMGNHALADLRVRISSAITGGGAVIAQLVTR